MDRFTEGAGPLWFVNSPRVGHTLLCRKFHGGVPPKLEPASGGVIGTSARLPDRVLPVLHSTNNNRLLGSARAVLQRPVCLSGAPGTRGDQSTLHTPGQVH